MERGNEMAKLKYMFVVISYSREIKITNLDQLARGTGARYIEVVDSHVPGEYVAVQWRRRLPVSVMTGHKFIRF